MLAELQARGLLELLDVELARALGRIVEPSSPEVELAIALTGRNVRLGHSCFPMDMSAAEIWPREAGRPAELPDVARWKDLIAASTLSDGGPLVLDEAGRLYLRRYWQLERDIARELALRSSTPPRMASDTPWLEASLERLFPGADDSPQRGAARNALQHSVSLLCGGPGTGKTTTVAAIVALMIEEHLQEAQAMPRVLLLAPTGKSAARLGEAVRKAKSGIATSIEVLAAIPEQATTLQRALGMRREGARFGRSADRPLEADVIVVDEASMVDLGLMRQLLNATPEDATLLIVGDPDQLTSVEAGSVLRDLVMASAQTAWKGGVTQLTKTYRYDEKQPLGQLIAAIRKGDGADVQRLLDLDDAKDLVWVSSAGLPAELDRAAAHWCTALSTRNPEQHFDLRGRYVMLTPFRRGRVGTRRLGAAVVDRLYQSEGREPAVRPIIIEENSHELKVYNGDFAMLVEGEPSIATVQSESEGFREIAEARLPRYSDAFALSVHKAQGSEFDEVLFILPDEDAPTLSRELLYTAVSRARHAVRLVGPKEVVLAALGRSARRYSGLVDAIAEALD
ncbi:MAG: exodeoxyribonuclease V subunit alpha [Polyangiales bacterium]